MHSVIIEREGLSTDIVVGCDTPVCLCHGKELLPTRDRIALRKCPISGDHRSDRFLNQTRRTPFGHSTQLRVFVDPDLLQHGEVWATAGTWNDDFGVNPNILVCVAGAVLTDLKRG